MALLKALLEEVGEWLVVAAVVALIACLFCYSSYSLPVLAVLFFVGGVYSKYQSNKRGK